MDEKLLIHNVLKGDTSSFNHFVDTYQDMAVTIAFRICSNLQEAEDIVQNSFVKAYHNLHTFRTDSKFSTWFYRIVYNTALTHIGQSRFMNEYVDYHEIDRDDSFSGGNVLEKIENNERKELINNAMEKLPRDESLLLTLFYLEDNSIKDICQITLLSESNVKVKLHRARKRLASILEGKIQYN